VSEPKILLLGGTAEAAELAARLHKRGIAVTTALAGRTREPAPLKGNIRTGGFGGPDGLAAFLLANRFTLLVDMTHPFATQMSENAMLASAQTGIPLLAFHRPGWEKGAGDQWIEVPDIAAAVDAIPSQARVLLALGSQHIAPFATRTDVHFVVRMVDRPDTPLFPFDHEVMTAKPGTVEEEFRLLESKGMTYIVCRNSGGKASYTKIAAARLLGLPIIMIGRKQFAGNKQSLVEFEHAVSAALA
jgi:precorrin-6A/cobalt-precorrin-6A reductase